MQPTLPLLARYLVAIVQRLVGPRQPQLWTTQPQRWPRCKECGEPLTRRRGGQLCAKCRKPQPISVHQQLTPAFHFCRQCSAPMPPGRLWNRCQRCMGELAQPHICLDCRALIEAGDYCEPCRLKRLFGAPPPILCARCRSTSVAEPGAICEECQATPGNPVTLSFDPSFETSFTGVAVISFRVVDPDNPSTGDTADTTDTDDAGDFSHIEQLLREIYWTKER